MKLSKNTLGLLESVEERIDPAAEEDFEAQWRDFLLGSGDGSAYPNGIFTPERKKLSEPPEFPDININDAIGDYDTMLAAQLKNVSDALNSRTRALSVRSNYGTGILSSLFGAEIFVMPRETNTLPTTRAFNDTEKIREIFSKGVPDVNAGFGRRVFEMGELFAETFERYPKIKRFVPVYHPDTQGPLDIAELLWGGEMFYAMYDEPELVHSVLRVITDTYARFLGRWFGLFPPSDGINTHWDYKFKGSIFLRDDSAMNLSPELYREFAFKYDSELLGKFGGGAIHFCGRGDHYIDIMAQIPDLYCVNLSQPHLNDMEKIYSSTLDRGIKLLHFDRKRALADSSRGYHGCMNSQ